MSVRLSVTPSVPTLSVADIANETKELLANTEEYLLVTKLENCLIKSPQLAVRSQEDALTPAKMNPETKRELQKLAYQLIHSENA